MNKKVVNNAISAYFGLAALLLVIPTRNDLIKNSFVKSHAKTALLIHFFMILTYVIFVSNRFLENITVLNYTLNHIITPLILMMLFGMLLYGVKKASIGDTFMVRDIKKMTKSEGLYEVNESNLSEKENLNIILSYIPFAGFFVDAKLFDQKNNIIINNAKLNLIITIFLLLLIVNSYDNLFTLFILFYIIFVVFSSILLVVNKSVININLSRIPRALEAYIFSKALFEYLKNYTTDREFVGLKTIIDEKTKDYLKVLDSEESRLKKYKNNKLPNFIYYIPFINIIGLIDIKSKYQNHIINGIGLNILFLLIMTLKPGYEIFVLIPFIYSIGYLKNIGYQIPILYDIYLLLQKIYFKLTKIYNKIREKQKENKQVSYKTKEPSIDTDSKKDIPNKPDKKDNDINELFNSKEDK